METEQESAPTKAAIYCRISQDREGLEHGVDRQEADCRALAERLGYEVAGVWTDNDAGASTKSTKPRPAYAEMLAAARAGEFTAVLAYSNSRLTRRPREFEDLIDLHDRHGVGFHTVASGSFDLATADGRRMARFLAGEATAESERISERVTRAKRSAAEQGKWRGGARPYGFEDDGVTLREAEAEVIREATRAVLAGRTLGGIVRDLNARGLVTSRDKEWNVNRLRDVLVRPRNAGLLHHGKASRGEVTIVKREAWPAIVDEETWNALFTKLRDPSRLTHNGTDRRWLGTGLFRCGRCGAPMRVTAMGRVGKKRAYHYRCEGANHLTIDQRKTDAHVLAVVAHLLRDPRVVESMHPQIEDDGELAAQRERLVVLRARQDAVTQDYADGFLTREQVKVATDRLAVEVGQIEARLAESTRRSVASPISSAADPGAAFLAAPVDVQRAVVRQVVSIEVQRAAQKGGVWDSSRITISRPSRSEQEAIGA